MLLRKTNDFTSDTSYSYHPQLSTLKLYRKRKIIETSDIAYLESDANYTIIYLKSGKTYISSFTMKHHIENLRGIHHFYRISRAHFVNLEYIKTKDDKQVVLKNGKVMKISRRRLKPLDESFENFLNKELY